MLKIEACEAINANEKEISFLMQEGYGDVAGAFNAANLQAAHQRTELVNVLDVLVSKALQQGVAPTQHFH